MIMTVDEVKALREQLKRFQKEVRRRSGPWFIEERQLRMEIDDALSLIEVMLDDYAEKQVRGDGAQPS